jgi:hypothetical protein
MKKFEKSSQRVEGFRFVIFITGLWRSNVDDELQSCSTYPFLICSLCVRACVHLCVYMVVLGVKFTVPNMISVAKIMCYTANRNSQIIRHTVF